MSHRKLTPVEKAEIVKLLAEKMLPKDIAVKFGCTTRTVHRLAQELKQSTDQICIQKCPQTSPERHSTKITVQVDSETSEKIFHRLRGLSIKAMHKIEEILEDEDTRTSDRLKAIQIIGSWTGMDKTGIDKFAQQSNAELDEQESILLSEMRQLLTPQDGGLKAADTEQMSKLRGKLADIRARQSAI